MNDPTCRFTWRWTFKVPHRCLFKQNRLRGWKIQLPSPPIEWFSCWGFNNMRKYWLCSFDLQNNSAGWLEYKNYLEENWYLFLKLGSAFKSEKTKCCIYEKNCGDICPVKCYAIFSPNRMLIINQGKSGKYHIMTCRWSWQSKSWLSKVFQHTICNLLSLTRFENFTVWMTSSLRPVNESPGWGRTPAWDTATDLSLSLLCWNLC